MAKDKNTVTSIQDYLRNKALGLLGLIDYDVSPRIRYEHLTFINNINDIKEDRLREYNCWYNGDEDDLLNFFTRANAFDFNTDPIYNRNKKSYFWSVASTERDIKRTHSGQPRNIVDTLVAIIGEPHIRARFEDVDKKLQDILLDNNFHNLVMQEARPLTFVEGWGAWRIDYDKNFRDTPILRYYRADAVDFVYMNRQLIAIIYKDFYQDKDKNDYVLFETRRKSGKDLIIEKDLFRMGGQGTDTIVPMELKDLPQLKDIEPRLIINDYPGFLGGPNIFYYDSSEECFGRSIYKGKTGLFDDLDQCMSQASNTVRRSTVHEYFDTLYLEKDTNTGMPLMPNVFDRKYIQFKSPIGADGSMGTGSPVTVTQPKLDFQQYSSEEIQILINMISGIMSPATLGIDIAKKDNAEAQREKEKVTIFTRNTVITQEQRIMYKLAQELLMAEELMRTDSISCKHYDLDVTYDEFADASFESKLNTILMGWQAGLISDELAVEYMYKNESDSFKDRELKYIKETKEKAEQGPYSEDELGDLGAMLGGSQNNPEAEIQNPENLLDDYGSNL